MKRLIRQGTILAGTLTITPFTPVTAAAQELTPVASVLGIQDQEYEPRPVNLLGGNVFVGATAQLEYDSNIFAQEFATTDDLKVIVQPYALLRKQAGAFDITGLARLNARKFFQNASEDAVGGDAEAGVRWQPTDADLVAFQAAYRHIVEDRGEPEGRTDPRLGPRELDALEGEVELAHEWSRLGVSVRGLGARLRYDDQSDRARDLDRYAALLRLSYRVSGTLRGFGEATISRRDFRLTAIGGQDRDATTYSGRMGIAVDPGGFIRGEAAVGLYRFTPDSPQFDSRNGFSAQASLIYQPRQRLAFTLDGFVGDVATYRTGAQSRQDTRVQFGLQQELFHNLRWQASAVYRRSAYFGTGIRERTYAGIGEIEYLASRRVRFGILVRAAERNSSAPLEDFERARAALQLKVSL
ncbi:outer membrane beta-barrel protein [Novosphingobium sp. RD2P27]|uniref:Outer membrane beta-barrel protein n=1 Tax=Novosphingobium kalidii TaxID=3230299 RepID=A0ABV2D4A3_9SPHN